MSKINLSKERIEELKEKVETGKKVFKQAYERFETNDMRLIWSAGKDSTLVLWICKQFCEENNKPMPPCFTIDEFDVFEEIDAMLKGYAEKWDLRLDWGLNVDLVKGANWKLDNDVEMSSLNERNRKEIERIGFGSLEKFPFEAESFIGNHLMKSVVFNQYIEDHEVKAVFQGLRWDEHIARKDDEAFEEVPAAEMVPAHTRIKPILQFSERDIWDATLYFDIPYCELYEQGYRSLGAKTTSLKLSNLAAWEQDLENTEERAGRRQDKEKTMDRLRKLGYM